MSESVNNINQTDNSEEWERAILTINKYLEEILFKIEWNYGDCRAPFVYPPKYDVKKYNEHTEYICTIKLEFSVSEFLVYKTGTPSELPCSVMRDLSKRFSFVE